MNKFLQLTTVEQRAIIADLASKMKVSPAIIEKDFWVVWALDKIFADENLSKKLRFKGGTSLSKAYSLIERFSEDIDLILDWRVVSNDNPLKERSKNQQDKFNKSINRLAENYIADTLLDELKLVLNPLELSIDKDHLHNIKIAYPSQESIDYLRPIILLEIGPLASWLPSEKRPIKSYLSEHFPQLSPDQECLVDVILPKRTFWEKATILHHETNRPANSQVPSRYSRHYYDLYKMLNSSVKADALKDLALLQEVIRFKQQFYSRSWAGYEQIMAEGIKLIPSNHIETAMEKDYREMQAMLFGNAPIWSEITKALELLEDEINLAIRSFTL